MKFIVKNKSTKGYQRLLDLKRVNGNYSNVKNDISQSDYIRDEVLTSLLEEQGFICAYCMRQIDLSNSTIEHIIGQNYIENGQELGKENQINYDNFLAVCKGTLCRSQLHCDKNRANYQKERPLFANPLKNIIIQNINFSEKGAVYYKNFIKLEEISKLKNHLISDEDSNIRYDLEVVLNLNCQNLKEKRALIIKAIKKLSDNGRKKEVLKKLLSKYEIKNDNKYSEFCEVVIKYIIKKI
ncbi:MAG TPA: hypothetical protein VLZ29_07970 [Sulfurimonas sp.]|uniref:hypothetical protein n=1 Tax=Sulfurimonas sp. TaxID=2022749 RepID=UPI002CC53D70|nr:hypothetical protein [Sulfurimonas sp.]HUH43038.1 hypothetical protein [Sulfurimonas sp.]